MHIVIVARKFELTGDISERLEKKLSKLDKFFAKETEAKVTIRGGEGVKTRIEVTFKQGGTIFRAEDADKDLYSAIDRIQAHLERQIRKNRTRLEKKLHLTKDNFAGFEDVVEEEELKISKVKRFEIQEMSVEEAIMQMNLLSHTFFMFKNSDSGDMNVVYKRKEND